VPYSSFPHSSRTGAWFLEERGKRPDITEERRRQAPLEPDEESFRAESEEATDRQEPTRDASKESVKEEQRTSDALSDDRQGKADEAR
jgi:hypothetical protein